MPVNFVLHITVEKYNECEFERIRKETTVILRYPILQEFTAKA
jgi:hypothetical protein